MIWILLLLLVLVVAALRSGYPIRQRRALFEHLSVVTRCALPIGAGLRALADERVASRSARDRKSAETIRGVAARFEAGGSLANAFEEAPRLLDATQLGLLRTAEQHGALPRAFELLSEDDAIASEGRWLLLEWLAYPAVVGTFVLLLGLFQTTVVAPKFMEIQRALEVGPAPQHLDAANAILGVTLLLIGLVLINVRRNAISPGLGRAVQSTCDLLLPRRPFRERRQGRLLRRLAALLQSGATLPEALDGVSELPDVGEPTLEHAAQAAREGQGLDAVLLTGLGADRSAWLPPALLSVERTGSLGAGLEAFGRRIEERATRRLRSVGEALKPVPILICGVAAFLHVHAVWGGIQAIETHAIQGVW